MRFTSWIGCTAGLLMVMGARAEAQTAAAPPAEWLVALQDGNGYLRQMLSSAAAQMSEADYAFRPTPEVRSFGQILAHVADANYFFCAAARGEKPPRQDVEKTSTDKAAIEASLKASFDYCDAVYAAGDLDPARSVEFMGRQRTPFTVLTFRNYHGMLHYGNVVTYMRLRGKVPPSSQAPMAH